MEHELTLAEIVTKASGIKKRAPRIGFTITEDQRSALESFVPWGNLTALYQAITEDLLELFEKHGSAKILAAVISRQIRFFDISKTLKEANESDSSTT